MSANIDDNTNVKTNVNITTNNSDDDDDKSNNV